MSISADAVDFVVIGSGFGGSVSAYRLSQKGYRVLVLEKGRRFGESDFSKGTTQPWRWLYNPKMGLRGIMKLTFLRHVTIMSGVGVGGGSLVYAATLPTPKDAFFDSGSWAGIRDWKKDLKPHYETALRMLGATRNPRLTAGDTVLRDIAREVGRETSFEATRVGILFNDPDHAGEPVDDPFFDGEGPSRRGCIECGACMTGCRHNAKNSLDKNYLYLAEKEGAKVFSETEVTDVYPAGLPDGSQGYFVKAKDCTGRTHILRSKGVVFAGGVMGTVPLLLALKKKRSLPNLSGKIGKDVRTNNESLTAVASVGHDRNFSEGVSIGSIMHPDDNSHLEAVVVGEKSGLWRFLFFPMGIGRTFWRRMGSVLTTFAREPIKLLRAWFGRDFANRTVTLLYMQHLDSTISLTLNRLGSLVSRVEAGHTAPTANMPEANKLAKIAEKLVGGKALRMSNEMFLGAPATAHILGGAVIGKDSDSGVIDDENRVFNYKNMYVCDGASISANPGVNPSLSITALVEHAMSKVPNRSQQADTRPAEVPESITRVV